MVVREALIWILSLLFVLVIAIMERNLPFALLFFLMISFVAYFFRDPERFPEGEGYLSPADGKVMKAKGRELSIFMGLTDVHVNRSPADGVVKRVRRIRGSHLPAFFRSSDRNERNEIVIETERGEVVVTQIVGFFARRIVCKVKEGEFLRRGDRIGYICFGSRVDVIFPEGTKLYVEEGDRVKAGETVVAVAE
ncbi:MAG: phosphatidylserine decarboxylase [Archaeoglobi archaeon]|nr:phosphatidylserine decarboxylase [Archaeoglobi archaeon]MDK2781854.1 phosphatidylserine decarboxylase [Archaeoglobi archaeon]